MFIQPVTNDDVNDPVGYFYKRALEIHIRLNDVIRALDTAKRFLNDGSYWASYAQKHPKEKVDRHLRMYRALEGSARIAFATLGPRVPDVIARVESECAKFAAEAEKRRLWDCYLPTRIAISNAVEALRMVRELLPKQCQDIKERLGASSSRDQYCRKAVVELFEYAKSELPACVEVHPLMVWVDSDCARVSPAPYRLRESQTARIALQTALERMTEHARTVQEEVYEEQVERLRDNAQKLAATQARQSDKRRLLNCLHLNVELADLDAEENYEKVKQCMMSFFELAEPGYRDTVDPCDRERQCPSLEVVANNTLVLAAELLSVHEARRASLNATLGNRMFDVASAHVDQLFFGEQAN